MNKKLILILSIISLFFSSYTTIAYPSNPTIIFDHVQYSMGDNVKITLYCEDNIDRFLVALRYGGLDGMDFVEDYDYKYISATGNSATITFRAAKADTYVGVEAWALDKDGIPSEVTTSEVYISDTPSNPIDYTADDTTSSFNLELFLIYSVIIIIALLVVILIVIQRKKH